MQKVNFIYFQPVLSFKNFITAIYFELATQIKNTFVFYNREEFFLEKPLLKGRLYFIKTPLAINVEEN